MFRALLRTDGDLVDTTGAIKHYIGADSHSIPTPNTQPLDT